VPARAASVTAAAVAFVPAGLACLFTVLPCTAVVGAGVGQTGCWRRTFVLARAVSDTAPGPVVACPACVAAVAPLSAVVAAVTPEAAGSVSAAAELPPTAVMAAGVWQTCVWMKGPVHACGAPPAVVDPVTASTSCCG
jgi:hypothetical protein